MPATLQFFERKTLDLTGPKDRTSRPTEMKPEDQQRREFAAAVLHDLTTILPQDQRAPGIQRRRAVSDLVAICQDPDHDVRTLPEDSRAILQVYGLMDQNGWVHPATRELVLTTLSQNGE